MTTEMTRIERFTELMVDHGPQTVISLVVLIVGLLLTKLILQSLRTALGKVIRNTTIVSIVCSIVGILLLALVIVSTASEAKLELEPVISGLTVICLAAVGILILFRPFLPSLPFKVGQTVKAGDLLGKIEAITVLNTRLRTFDGKTFFVPNRKILNEVVMNYQFTATRRVKLDVGIRYDQDLMMAKQALEAVMTADPRVKAKPGPVVYVLSLAANCVELGGRCWVDNAKYWVTKCDLLEKTKFAFDHAGIVFAFPQLDIHHYNNSVPGFITASTEESEAEIARVLTEQKQQPRK